MVMQESKQQLRERLLVRRRDSSATERAAVGAANADHLMTFTALVADAMHAVGPTASAQPFTVCAYFPLPSEPLSPTLLWQLRQHGLTVLLPVTVPGQPLDWCELTSTSMGEAPMTRTALGVTEPAGPRLGAAAITSAQLILVPALAADLTGRRLGRGGGYYDRSLALLRQAHLRPVRVAVINNDELLPHVPADAHDELITHVVSPIAGVQPTTAADDQRS